MEVLNDWFEVMDMEVECVTDKEIMITDYGWDIEGEIRIETIKYWCDYFIEMMEYKISQDKEYTEMVEQFTKEIKELEILSAIA